MSDSQNIVVGVIYRPNTAPKADFDLFTSTLFDIMQSINNEHKLCVIMGDMNVDLLQYSKHKKTNDYLDTIFSLGYLPVITKPTRVCPSSATLIDHMYTNSLTRQLIPAIVLTDVADHFATCLLIRNKSKRIDNKTHTYRVFSERNIATYNNFLIDIDFSPVINETCANTAYDKLMDLQQNAFNAAFPMKKGNKQNKNSKIQPWASLEFIMSSRRKTKLLKEKCKHPTEVNINIYIKSTIAHIIA